MSDSSTCRWALSLGGRGWELWLHSPSRDWWPQESGLLLWRSVDTKCHWIWATPLNPHSADLLVLSCQDFLSIGSDWPGSLREDKWEAGCQKALAKVNQFGGQGREVKSLQPHHFASIHITHQIRRKMGHICTITQGTVSMATITQKSTPDSCNSRSKQRRLWEWETCVGTQRMASFYS